jgi:anthranilate/para-aminobenzoate synthase component II
MKRKLSVLINEKTGNDSCLDFLKLKYEVNVVNFNKTFEDFGGINPDTVDLVLFTGGEDVDPKYYNQKPGKHTSYNVNRDAVEAKMFKSVPANFPKLGICRGAQFLTVMSGGSLIQHVENHGIGGTHDITMTHLYGGKRIAMTSTHHQMMNPFRMREDKDYILCAHSTNFLSPVYLNGSDTNIKIDETFLEPEIVFYPIHNSLAIQGHPESRVMTAEDQLFILNYIDKILKL